MMREAGKREKGKGEGREGFARFFSFHLSPFRFTRSSSGRGFTLIELVITITVMSVLTLGIVPLVKTSVRRQKEQRLREALRQMRTAIDEFKRDTVGMQCGPGGAVVTAPPATGPSNVPVAPGQGVTWLDPRSRVVVADCKLFGVDNPERLPPDLQTLVDGVDVVPRLSAMGPGIGSVSTAGGGATANSGGLVPKKKIYLRELPVDPITGEQDWCVRSSYDPPDEGCSSASSENVFDVRSKSEQTALNGEKYSDW